MNETNYRNQLQVDLSAAGIRVWRHVVSLLFARDGTPVQVGTPGQGDLWGIYPITITQEMVGKKVGLFISIETKSKDGRTQADRAKKQADWADMINKMGGIAIFARPGDDVIGMLTERLKGI